jgi:hypothetical protein
LPKLERKGSSKLANKKLQMFGRKKTACEE